MGGHPDKERDDPDYRTGEEPQASQVTSATTRERLLALLVGLDLPALTQHWSTGGAWPRLEDIPALVVRQFLEGAAAPASQDSRGRSRP